MTDGQIQTAWAGDQFQFAASSGAVSKNPQDQQLDEDTGLLRSPPQEQGLSSNANVLLYGFGGNGARAGGTARTCTTSYTPSGSGSGRACPTRWRVMRWY